ncbi:uncharacterized protein LOC129756716 [Uranotaenia lowii]|uniref:uncharacterized protein LOC129756716 n=1 Tax=Uranotaenia lowii TaxID=190385 RepID=UPI002478AB11|nr:uncharacterized protein LOC129756716 [Uranotaenia lowii]
MTTNSERPFAAQFPKKPEVGDEVIVKGKLLSNAKVFSVNFILPHPPPPNQNAEPMPPELGEQPSTPEPCCGRPSGTHNHQKSSPPYIAYHFKTVFEGDEDDEGVVVQNWKNVVWQQEHRSPNTWLRDRRQRFSLIFRFHQDTIRVFVDHAHHGPDYEFEYQVPLDRIRYIELWDDVEFVEEVTFRFKSLRDRFQEEVNESY